MLAAAGVVPGDRVAIMSENRPELLDLILASAWMGAIAVPLNPGLRGDGLAHQLTDSGASVLAVEDVFAPAVDAISRPPTLRTIWSLDRGLPPLGEPLAPAAVGPGDTAVVLYTSGTTGPAKGVECPHVQFWWWGTSVAEQLEITADDVLYTCLPLYHSNALAAFFQALTTGAVLHVGPRFSASKLLDRLVETGATVTYLLGAMVAILLSRAPAPTDRQHRVTRALAPSTAADQWHAFRDRFGVALLDGYGSTETNAVIGATASTQRPGWMGVVRPGFSARVVDAADYPVPDGTVGELVVRSDAPYAMSRGYWGNPEKTVEAWTNLWFHTGDLVERSADGWFRFHDRVKDCIRRRGENISSFEVEQAVRSHPSVSAVAAFALPSELGEDEVAVAVVAHRPVTEAELVAWCGGRLAYFAVPRFVQLRTDLPVTENGKVRKAQLRAVGVQQFWDRVAAGVEVVR